MQVGVLERANPPAMAARTARTRLAAGLPGAVFAIDRAGELNGQCLGAHAGRTGEQVPVGKTVLLYGLHEPLPLLLVTYNAIESHIMNGSSGGADHVVDPVGSLRRFLETEAVERAEYVIAGLPADLRQPGHGIDPLFVAFPGGKPLPAAVEG